MALKTPALPSRFLPALCALVTLPLLLGACETGQTDQVVREQWPAPEVATGHRSPFETLVAETLAVEPATRARAVAALGRVGGDDAARAIAPLLGDGDPTVQADAAFALGATGSDLAPGLMQAGLPADAAPDVVESAVMGMGNITAPEAEQQIVALCLRESAPVHGPEALYNHYYWRRLDRQIVPPQRLPDDRLLAYETHVDPRGRAGIGWMGRLVKDPRLLEPLMRLASDPQSTVRRAAALGLGDGSKGAPAEGTKPARADLTRADGDARRALESLGRLVSDTEPSVVIAAAGSLASYERAESAALLKPALTHPYFGVRVAVIQGLARRKVTHVSTALAKYVREDPSIGVRFEAAVALPALNEKIARTIVPVLLRSEHPYLRVAATNVLGELGDPESVRRLETLARADPSVQVREYALSALAGKQGDDVADAVHRGLADEDPGVVAAACDVAAKNGMTGQIERLRVIPVRYPGMANADARVGALRALTELEDPGVADVARSLLGDPDMSVRFEARKALAKAEGRDPPNAWAAEGRLGVDELDPELDAWVRRLTPSTTLTVKTSEGKFRIHLDPQRAPLHCAHIVSLAESGFYDGLDWHRVVPDFVIQGGCPRGDGSGNGGLALPLEPTAIPYARGTLGMPRSPHPDSGGCQLFISLARQPHLDLRYTAFGRVVSGMHVLDRIDVESKIESITVEGLR